MRNYGKDILRLLKGKFWLQCSIIGGVIEGIELLDVFIGMDEVFVL